MRGIVDMSAKFRKDLVWWLEFSKHFNGKARMLRRLSLLISSDSDALNWDFGALHGVDWLMGSFVKDDDLALEGFVGHHHVRSEVHLPSSHIHVRDSLSPVRDRIRWKDSTFVLVTDSVVVQPWGHPDWNYVLYEETLVISG